MKNHGSFTSPSGFMHFEGRRYMNSTTFPGLGAQPHLALTDSLHGPHAPTFSKWLLGASGWTICIVLTPTRKSWCYPHFIDQKTAVTSHGHRAKSQSGFRHSCCSQTNLYKPRAAPCKASAQREAIHVYWGMVGRPQKRWWHLSRTLVNSTLTFRKGGERIPDRG